MDRWRGKVAVVTGAASGIGAAITERLLEAGINVVGLDLQLGRLQETADRWDKVIGGTLYPLKCDLTSGEAIDQAFDWVVKNLNCVHIMVNNAGVISYTPIVESDRATFERLVSVNILAMATCTSKAVQIMIANKVEGHIFNTNSILGQIIPEGTLSEVAGSNGWNLYPTTKHATRAMTHTVRGEISRCGAPIRVTGINPGLVKTEISKHVEDMKDLFEEVLAINPSDVADALIYALGTRPEVQITEITVQRTGETP